MALQAIFGLWRQLFGYPGFWIEKGTINECKSLCELSDEFKRTKHSKEKKRKERKKEKKKKKKERKRKIIERKKQTKIHKNQSNLFFKLSYYIYPIYFSDFQSFI